ncbi:hypothetical protein DERP_012466 [Dermatophagoides pteronyssinus]|uniref:Uncharacterized protein n=1 Tax=Dermatophagoides pteronyssinus TaxID=6956 RepID=A0ABQ8IX45_DERPT|nr:hypothetical protein DERP_012466 [Dermatophagoides pteronyssinus]
MAARYILFCGLFFCRNSFDFQFGITLLSFNNLGFIRGPHDCPKHSLITNDNIVAVNHMIIDFAVVVVVEIRIIIIFDSKNNN